MQRGRGLAIDSSRGKLYLLAKIGFGGNDGMLSMDLDGSNRQVVFQLDGIGTLTGLVFDSPSGYLYFCHSTAIMRVHPDIGIPETVVNGPGSWVDLTIDSQNGRLYWIDVNVQSIQRANLDGSDIQTIVSGLDFTTSLTLEPLTQKLYWMDTNSLKIQRANTDGTQLEDFAASALISNGDIEVFFE